MVSYFKIILTITLFIIISFIIISALQISLLNDPLVMMKNNSITSAVFGVLLLISDVILPVPSSLVMMANGALFGITIGMFLSVTGGVGAAIAGYVLGKSGSSYINRIVSETEQKRAIHLMNKYGMVALIVSRSIPVLSETMSVIAGITKVSTSRMLLASTLGVIPTAAIYAFTGAYAMNVESGIWSFLLVIGVASIFWFLNKLIFKLS